MTNAGAEYPQSEAGEILLDASAIPKDDDEARDELTGEVSHYQTINPKVTQTIRAVKGYCAIGRGAKKAEDGRRTPSFGRYSRGANDGIQYWRGGI